MWNIPWSVISLALLVALQCHRPTEGWLPPSGRAGGRASSSSATISTTTTRLRALGGGTAATLLRRARDSVTGRERSREDLKLGIAGFYDRSSKLWEDVWGEQ